MACTYDLTTDIGKVRLHIGDSDCSANQFEDAELQVFLDQASGEGMAGSAMVWAASGLALIAWAVELAREDELVKTGSWTGDRRDVAGKMNAKAKEYLDLAGFDPARSPVFYSTPVDWNVSVKAERQLTD